MATYCEAIYGHFAHSLLDDIVNASDPSSEPAVDILVGLRKVTNRHPVTLDILQKTKIGKCLTKTVKVCRIRKLLDDDWDKAFEYSKALLEEFMEIAKLARETRRRNGAASAKTDARGGKRARKNANPAMKFNIAADGESAANGKEKSLAEEDGSMTMDSKDGDSSDSTERKGEDVRRRRRTRRGRRKKSEAIGRKAIGRKDEEIKALKAALEYSKANSDTKDAEIARKNVDGRKDEEIKALKAALEYSKINSDTKDAEIAWKNVVIAQKDEAIGRKDEEIKALKVALENSKSKIDTVVDLTNEEEEPPEKRKRTAEPLSVTLQRESNHRLARVKQEKVEAESILGVVREGQRAAEAALEDAKEDLEIANDTLLQQARFTDSWQTRFDEVAEVAAAIGADASVISGIRNRAVV